MRPSLVILPAPSLDQHLSFPQGLKHLPVEQLIPEFSVKTLRIAILPRTARLDLQGTGSQSLEPVLRLPGNKLRPIVGNEETPARPVPRIRQFMHQGHSFGALSLPDGIYHGQTRDGVESCVNWWRKNEARWGQVRGAERPPVCMGLGVESTV